MKLKSLLAITGGLLFTTGPITFAQTAAPLRTYAVTGTENTRSYDSATGWTVSAPTYIGTFDLLSLTEARLTKLYPDGTSVVRDLVLQWVMDLNAPAQSGAAAERPDPNDPIIERTTYVIALQYDGARYTMSATFKTLAYLTIAGRTDWYQVAYGDLSGYVVSPLGSYNISGSEQAGKTLASYTGTFALLSSTTGRFVRIYADGTTATVNLALSTAVDFAAPTQSLTALQVENSSGQSTAYVIDLALNGTRYDVNAVWQTTSKGRSGRTLATGTFGGGQP